MAIVAVFGQTTLQLLDVRAQLFYLRFQGQQCPYLRTKRGIFFPQSGVFFSKHLDFVLHHVFTVLLSARFGKGSRSPEQLRKGKETSLSGELLTVKQVQERLKVSERTVFNPMQRGE